MVLCWNLIGRSNTVGSIMLQHMDMGGDCVKIKLLDELRQVYRLLIWL